MDITLLVGAHHTDMVGVETCLKHHRSTFSEAGVVIWTRAEMRRLFDAGLTSPLAEDQPQMMRRSERSRGLMRLRMQKSAALGICETIICDDRLLGPDRENLRQARLYPQAHIYLKRISHALGGVRRVGLTIRDYERFWDDVIATQIIRGHKAPAKALLDQLVTQPRRWGDVVDDIRSAFPTAEIIITPFERFADRPEDHIAVKTGSQPFSPLSTQRVQPSLEAVNAALSDRGETVLDTLSFFGSDHKMALHALYRDDLLRFRGLKDGKITYCEDVKKPDLPMKARGSDHDGEKVPLERHRNRGNEGSLPRYADMADAGRD